MGTTHYTYDAAGNPETILEPDGTLTTIAHDGRNRQLSITRNGITCDLPKYYQTFYRIGGRRI